MTYLSVLFFSLTLFLTPPLELTGKFDATRIPEASGIVKSRKYPGIFWVHNDSGNLPLLFAVRSDAQIVASFRLAIPNIDWEDLTLDDQGHLYLGDIGNNSGLLRIRAIYRIDEPNPFAPSPKTPLVPSASYYFQLPKGHYFDSESLIYDRGFATLIVKSHHNRDPEMFRLDLAKPASLTRPAQLIPAGKLPAFTEPATGASLSADGRHLAVCSSSITRIYRKADQERWHLISEVKYEPLQVEGITWDHDDLMLAVERVGLCRLSEQVWRATSLASPRSIQFAPVGK